MADGSIVIDAKIDTKDLNKELGNFKSKMKKSFADLRDVMQGPVAAIGLLVKGFTSLGKAIIKPASIIEDMTAAFTPLVGSLEKAEEMIAALNQTAATTPFQLEDIGSAAKQLLPILGNDTQKVVDTFRMLGDTAGGNAQKLQSITRGYSKAMLKGRVDMEALNMIAEAGVPIYTELAESMGVSVEEMMELSSQGKISGDALTGAFEKMTSEGGIFFSGMDIASQTLNGKISTLKDQFFLLSAGLGERLLPAVKGIVSVFSGMIGGISELVQDKGDLKKATSDLVAAYKEYDSITKTLAGNTDNLSKQERKVLEVRKNLASVEIEKEMIKLADAYEITLNRASKYQNQIDEMKTSVEALSAEEERLSSMTREQAAVFGTAMHELELLEVRKELVSQSDDLSQTESKLIGVNKDLQSGIESIAKSYNSGSINIDTYAITNEKLYNRIIETANALSIANKEEKKLTATREEAESRALLKAESEKKAKDQLEDYIKLVNTEYSRTEQGIIDGLEKEIQLWTQYASTADKTLPKVQAILEAKKSELALITSKNKTTQEENKLYSLQLEYTNQLSISSAKLATGYIDQDEHMRNATNAARKYIDALYEMGVTAESSAEDGGDALRKMLAVLSSGENKVQAFDSGNSAGMSIVDGFTSGLSENASKIFTVAKSVIKGIGQTIQKGIALLGKAVSWIVAFDPKKMAESMKDLAKGIDKFFKKDIYQISNLITLGADLIVNLIEGILKEKDSIFEAAENIIETFTDAIIENADFVVGGILQIIEGLAKAVLNNLGKILQAGHEIAKAFTQGIIDNADEIFKGIIQAINIVASFIKENLSEIIGLALALITAIASALITNMPELVDAFMNLIVAVIMGVVDALPEITYAFTYLVISIVLLLASQIVMMPLYVINAFLSLLQAVVTGLASGDWSEFADLGGDIVKGFGDGIGAAFGDFFTMFTKLFTGIIDKVKSIFGIHSPSTVFSDIGKNIIQGLINGITGMLGALGSVVSNVIDTVAGIGGDIWDGVTSVGSSIGKTVGNIGSSIGKSVGGFFGFANGTMNAPGGLSIVGERGPELINLPKGSQVYTAGQTSAMLSKASSATAPIVMPRNNGNNIIKINEIIEIDGQAIGRVSFEYLDRMAGVS